MCLGMGERFTFEKVITPILKLRKLYDTQDKDRFSNENTNPAIINQSALV